MAAGERSDAMWFASYDEHKTIPAGLSHPTNIRRWFNEQPKVALEDQHKDVKADKVDQRTAEKVSKLVQRKEAKDEGSEMAGRHLDAIAKKKLWG